MWLWSYFRDFLLYTKISHVFLSFRIWDSHIFFSFRMSDFHIFIPDTLIKNRRKKLRICERKIALAEITDLFYKSFNWGFRFTSIEISWSGHRLSFWWWNFHASKMCFIEEVLTNKYAQDSIFSSFVSLTRHITLETWYLMQIHCFVSCLVRNIYR